MSDKPWKAEERTVARMFGTSRQLMKGTDEKSDIISGLFTVDVKLRKKWWPQMVAMAYWKGNWGHKLLIVWQPQRLCGQGYGAEAAI